MTQLADKASTTKRKGMLGNRNAYRHGLYSPRLARAERYPDKRAAVFRRGMEDAVLTLRGEITVLAAALIHSAAEAQKVAFVNRVAKRKAEAKGLLTPELALMFDRDYLRALDLRDRKLGMLRLDKEQNAVAALYGTPCDDLSEDPPPAEVSPAGQQEAHGADAAQHEGQDP